MPDSDRLQELKRQRALVQEQLAWLDREIAASSVSPPASSISAQAAAILARERKPAGPKPNPTLSVVDLAVASGDPEEMLNQLMAQEKKSGEFSKQGCWALFLGLMIAAGLAVAAIGYFFYR